MAKTPEGQIKEDCKKLFEANGFYYRSLAIGVIPGRSNPSKGMPDAIILKNGYAAWVEYKGDKGKLRPEQETFIFEWTAHGGNVFVVRSLEDAQKIVSEVNLRSRLKAHQCPLGEGKCTRPAPPSA